QLKSAGEVLAEAGAFLCRRSHGAADKLHKRHRQVCAGISCSYRRKTRSSRERTRSLPPYRNLRRWLQSVRADVAPARLWLRSAPRQDERLRRRRKTFLVNRQGCNRLLFANYSLQYPQHIAAHDFLDVHLAVSALEQGRSQIRHFRNVFES